VKFLAPQEENKISLSGLRISYPLACHESAAMRVLIVDDDIVQITLISALVEAFDVDHVSNGDDALQMFRNAHGQSRPYGLIFMDLMMPGFDGYMVVDAIRKLETEKSWQPTKVIVITGKDPKDGLTDQLRQQCQDYLMKPVNADALLQSLEELKLI
jgi:two-component system, chemotaxis family, chemotaxis protein CheY